MKKIQRLYVGSMSILLCLGCCWIAAAQDAGEALLIPMASIEQQLEIANEYFEKQHFLTPENENAFEIYQAVLERDPDNHHAREKILEMAGMYKAWAEDAYTGKNTDKARIYYDRYRILAEYLAYTLQDQSMQQALRDMQERLSVLGIALSPTPTPIPTPTPFPTPTQTPQRGFQITEIIITDAANRLLLPKDDIYTLRLHETVNVTVNFTMPPECRPDIAWSAKYGKVPSTRENVTTYTAMKPGADHLIVTIWDQETGEDLTETINILVVE